MSVIFSGTFYDKVGNSGDGSWPRAFAAACMPGSARSRSRHSLKALHSLFKPIGNVGMLQVVQFLGLYPEESAGGRLQLSSTLTKLIFPLCLHCAPSFPCVFPSQYLPSFSHVPLRVQRVSIPWLMGKTLKPATRQ